MTKYLCRHEQKYNR